MFKPFLHLSRQLIGGSAFFLNKKSRFLLREAGSVNIVILGAGFAGLCSSIYLHQFLGKYKNIRITVIDKNSHHLFLPFLHEVATGSVPPEIVCCIVSTIYINSIYQIVKEYYDFSIIFSSPYIFGLDGMLKI